MAAEQEDVILLSSDDDNEEAESSTKLQEKVNGTDDAELTNDLNNSQNDSFQDDDIVELLEMVAPAAIISPRKPPANGSAVNGEGSDGAVNGQENGNTQEIMKEDAKNAVLDFVYKLKNFMKPKERSTISAKMNAKFEKVNFSSVDDVNKLKRKFETEMLALTKQNAFRSTLGLMNYLEKLRKPRAEKDPEVEEQKRQTKLQEKIVQLEKKLKKIERTIEEYDHLEVDFEDEVNSSYLVRTRAINKYMENYKLLCRVSGCNYNTGRPIEKRIKLKDRSRFPEINEAIEKFMNSKPLLFIPDYHDIKDLVAETNRRSVPPLLAEEDVVKEARYMFEEVVKIMKVRRFQDFQLAVPVIEENEDPAEADEELRKKLEENDKSRKSEIEIIDSFVKKQDEEQGDAKEDEDVEDGSRTSESDDEDEEEDLKAEREHDTDLVGADTGKQHFSRDEVEEEDESEDEMEPDEMGDRSSTNTNQNEVEENDAPPRKKTCVEIE